MEPPEQQILRVVIENMDRCGVCHRLFEESDVEVISRRDDVWVMVVRCEDCHARSFVAAQIGTSSLEIEDHLFELASEGLLHDDSFPGQSLPMFETTEPEIDREPVDADDVDEMQEFLRDFNGDFKNLFGES